MPSLDDLRTALRAFRDKRDWAKFHTSKNLSASICIEAAELLELLQWVEGPEAESSARDRQDEFRDEIADVLIYTLLLADHLGIDPGEAVLRKIEANEKRYPVELARGNARKHDCLRDDERR